MIRKITSSIRQFNWKYWLLLVAVGIGLIVVLEPYGTLISQNANGQIAVGFTILFLTGFYLGKYIAAIYISGRQPITSSVFITLLIVIVATIIILFVHAQFLFNNESAARSFPINVLIGSMSVSILSITSGLAIRLGQHYIGHELKTAKASAAQSLSELQFLQSQLSPHFLFNTLNNLYGISLSQHEKVPGLLLKLSDLLRYAVYDAKTMYVPLKNEISYINNYIDFEKLRIGSRLKLHTEIETVDDERISIPPLLLIVFMENAFKHAKNTATGDVYISIILKTFGGDILFAVENSYNKDAEKGGFSSTSDKNNGGLGLENVRKRLDLLYPDLYELYIATESDKHSVRLQLKNKQ